MYEHFLITRFNLRSEEWTKTKEGEDVLTTQWLKKRFEIFEQFTLPSVVNQTEKNFLWLVFFDRYTPAYFKQRALAITNPYDFIKVYFIDGMEVYLSSITSSIELLRKKLVFVITTRLDNDDILHKRFIHTVQLMFKPQAGLLIDIRKGFQLSTESKHMELRHFYDEFTHFISLVEYGNQINSIFCKRLEEWRNEPLFLSNSSEALFIEIVHGGNIVNAVMKHQPFVLNFREKEFGITSGTIKSYSKLKVIYKNRVYYGLKMVYLIGKFLRLRKPALTVSF